MSDPIYPAGLFYAAGSFGDWMTEAPAREAAGAGHPEPYAAAAKQMGESVWAHGGLGRAGLHALAGCGGAIAGGGKCGGGALSAGFAEIAGPRLDALGAPPLVARVLIGGASSALGGGKFANGAMTAAFGYLFNCLSHPGSCTAKDVPEIQKGLAECKTRGCTVQHLEFAKEAGMKVPLDMGGVLKDFFDVTSLPARIMTPVGRGFDVVYGFGEAVYERWANNNSTDLKTWGLFTTLNIAMDRQAVFHAVNFNGLEAFNAATFKWMENVTKNCIEPGKCQ